MKGDVVGKINKQEHLQMIHNSTEQRFAYHVSLGQTIAFAVGEYRIRHLQNAQRPCTLPSCGGTNGWKGEKQLC